MQNEASEADQDAGPPATSLAPALVGDGATSAVVADPDAAADGGGPATIVAIGASAGGLEAIEQFFAAVEVPSPFAFVIVQHLSPDFKSLMVELLARRTLLAVGAVEDGMAPSANAIHLIPPGKTMTIEGGLLRLVDRDERDLVHHPIDEFFVSLASDRGAAAIGIVLSGSGNDGSRGARAIRRAGGRVLVQLPATAKFSSMPQSAIEAGCTDEVMAPDTMAEALLEAGPAPPVEGVAVADLPASLVACLDSAFGIDFSAYRNETVQRRVQRRMMLRGFDQIEAYADFVADDTDEQEALYQDLLIGVTAFFRDLEAFEALEREVVPDLAARLDAGEEVRVWVPACATGEEAYSLAILVLARCRRPLEELPLRVFATDVHRRSLAVAAAGFYSEEAVANVRSEWQRRYFSRRGSGYQVIPAVRRMIIFSPHDLLRDPPFTTLALLSCRNFLIYLRREAQTQVIASFAFALQPGGHLLLGSSESAVGNDEAFLAIDREARLFRRRRADKPATTGNGQAAERGSVVAAALSAQGRQLTVAQGGALARDRRDQRLTMAYELLLDRYVPPSLLVDETGQVVHCFGDAGPWLKAPRGRPSLAVLDMVRDELRAPLASAINRVRRTGHPITLARLGLGAGEAGRVLPRLVVEVPPARAGGQRCLLVSFDDRPGTAELAEGPVPAELDEQALSRIDELERDLRFSEDSLKNTIEALEAANEELQAANEELMASNEELMASNEELHSVNEEMHTVGIEHQRKIEELQQLGQDMDSLLQSAALAALFVDPDLLVRRFTPALTDYFNLLPQDVGRPLAHVTHRFADVDLAGLLEGVARSGEAASRDLATTDGRIARLNAVPYRVAGDRIAGLTVSVQDVTEAARNGARLGRLERAVKLLLDETALPLALAEPAAPDGLLAVTAVNPPMAALAGPGHGEAALLGQPLAAFLEPLLGPGETAIGRRLEALLAAGSGSAAWPLAAGGSVTLELHPVAGDRLAIVRATTRDLSSATGAA